eukprot:EG_transcript_17636
MAHSGALPAPAWVALVTLCCLASPGLAAQAQSQVVQTATFRRLPVRGHGVGTASRTLWAATPPAPGDTGAGSRPTAPRPEAARSPALLWATLGCILLGASAWVVGLFHSIAHRATPCPPTFTMASITGGGTPVPKDHGDVLRHSLRSTIRLLNEGVGLVEISFPGVGLTSAYGGNVVQEIPETAAFVSKFTQGLPRIDRDTDMFKAIRVFFPDKPQMKEYAKLFADQPHVRLDYLHETGLDYFFQKPRPLFQPDDRLFVMAYPSFSVDQIVRIQEIHRADPLKRPIVVINGDFESIRAIADPNTNQFDNLLQFLSPDEPELPQLQAEFLPRFEQALFLHNFLGDRGGLLFRVYPEPW